MQKILPSHRVSAQSLGMACITSAVDVHPSHLMSLDSITTFMTAQDPKLRSSVTKVYNTFLQAYKLYLS